MKLSQLAIANLKNKPLSTGLNVVLLALATASIVILLLLSKQLTGTLERDAKGIDLVLGAKGSPVQLVLSSVYHADIPTGNIPLAAAEEWANHRHVKAAVPLALGDSYRGFRIVGTTTDYPDWYNAKLASGDYWQAPLQAVVGSKAAEQADLTIGSKFSSSHGMSNLGDVHDEQPYTVVGVLAPSGTVIDKLILTATESVWLAHDHHGHEEHEEHEEHKHDDREITAMLIKFSTPLAAASLPRTINAQSDLQAAAPAFELTRLLQLIGIGLDGLKAFAAILILTAAFSLFGALYSALNERRGELALLRCLGATRSQVMQTLLLEGLLLSALGTLIGLLCGHLAVELVANYLPNAKEISVTGWIWLQEELYLITGLVAVGIIAAALPAWQAYRSDVSKVLSHYR